MKTVGNKIIILDKDEKVEFAQRRGMTVLREVYEGHYKTEHLTYAGLSGYVALYEQGMVAQKSSFDHEMLKLTLADLVLWALLIE